MEYNIKDTIAELIPETTHVEDVAGEGTLAFMEWDRQRRADLDKLKGCLSDELIEAAKADGRTPAKLWEEIANIVQAAIDKHHAEERRAAGETMARKIQA